MTPSTMAIEYDRYTGQRGEIGQNGHPGKNTASLEEYLPTQTEQPLRTDGNGSHDLFLVKKKQERIPTYEDIVHAVHVLQQAAERIATQSIDQIEGRNLQVTAILLDGIEQILCCGMEGKGSYHGYIKNTFQEGLGKMGITVRYETKHPMQQINDPAYLLSRVMSH